MDIFQFDSYKQILRATIEQNSKNRGYQTRLAKAAGCSRSFLSQVLSPSGNIDLTRDHGAGLCEIWNFDENEVEYYLTLIDFARARSEKLQDLTARKLKKLRLERINLSKRTQREVIETAEEEAIYFSSWFPAAVCMLLTIPKYRNPKAIASRLNVSQIEVERTLETLARIKMAVNEKGHWKATKKDINLSEISPMSPVNHSNWRNRAISSIQLRKPDSTHFSSVFTISYKDAQILQSTLQDMIVRSRQIIVDSAEEELYCLNVDFFQV